MDKYWVGAIKKYKPLLFNCWCWTTWLWLESCRKPTSAVSCLLGLTGTLGDCKMSQFIHYVWAKPLLFILILVGHDKKSFSLQINITKDITSIVQRVKDFSMISFLCKLLLLTIFWKFYNISYFCKYPAGNCMFCSVFNNIISLSSHEQWWEKYCSKRSLVKHTWSRQTYCIIE